MLDAKLSEASILKKLLDGEHYLWHVEAMLIAC